MPVGDRLRVRGQPVDQVGDPGAAERAQRRPDRHPAGPARQLRHLVERVARPGVGLDQVVGVHPERRRAARPGRARSRCRSRTAR